MAGQHLELRKSTADLMILAAIEAQPRHGYDIARYVDRESDGRLRFHVASFYPMLYRLERRGWIRGRWVEKAGQRRRRYYRLTPTGQKVLAAQRREWQDLLVALNRVARISEP